MLNLGQSTDRCQVVTTLQLAESQIVDTVKRPHYELIHHGHKSSGMLATPTKNRDSEVSSVTPLANVGAPIHQIADAQMATRAAKVKMKAFMTGIPKSCHKFG